MNFLVEWHFGRLNPAGPEFRLLDAAGFLILERESHARRRGAVVRSYVTEVVVRYLPRNPFDGFARFQERFNGLDMTAVEQPGPASLPVILCFGALALPAVRHCVSSRDGLIGASVWRRP
jgi:hypothetical protein